MGTFYFVDKADIIKRWLIAKGFDESLHDSLLLYFRTKTSVNSSKLYDLIYKTMQDLGYSGTIKDKLNQFFPEKMGVSDPKRAERLFWRDLTTDFSLEAPTSDGLITEDGDPLTTEGGDQLFTEGD